MKFIFYSQKILDDAKISIDGLVPNSFHLSHWRGNQTPPEFQADTSTEIAIKFVTHPSHHQYLQDYPILSNNHFDTDGLLAVWTVLSPHSALPQRDLLIQAAEAGDFSEFTTEKALKINLLLTAFRNSVQSPFAPSLKNLTEEAQDALCYAKLIEHLPTLLANPEAHEGLWKSEFQKILDSFEKFEKGEIIRKEFKDEAFSVLVCSETPSRYAINHYCEGDLFLIVQIQPEGFCYDLDYRYYSWAETISRPTIHQISMEPLANRLNVYNGRAEGQWMCQGFKGKSLTTVLKYTNPMGDSLSNRFPYERVAGLVRDYIQENKNHITRG